MHKKFQEFQLLLGAMSFIRPMQPLVERQEARPCCFSRWFGRGRRAEEQTRPVAEESRLESRLVFSLYSREQPPLEIYGNPPDVGAALRYFLRWIGPENIDGEIDPYVLQATQTAFSQAARVAGIFPLGKNILHREFTDALLAQPCREDLPTKCLKVTMNGVIPLFVQGPNTAARLVSLFLGDFGPGPDWTEPMRQAFLGQYRRGPCSPRIGATFAFRGHYADHFNVARIPQSIPEIPPLDKILKFYGALSALVEELLKDDRAQTTTGPTLKHIKMNYDILSALVEGLGYQGVGLQQRSRTIQRIKEARREVEQLLLNLRRINAEINPTTIQRIEYTHSTANKLLEEFIKAHKERIEAETEECFLE